MEKTQENIVDIENIIKENKEFAIKITLVNTLIFISFSIGILLSLKFINLLENAYNNLFIIPLTIISLFIINSFLSKEDVTTFVGYIYISIFSFLIGFFSIIFLAFKFNLFSFLSIESISFIFAIMYFLMFIYILISNKISIYIYNLLSSLIILSILFFENWIEFSLFNFLIYFLGIYILLNTLFHYLEENIHKSKENNSYYSNSVAVTNIIFVLSLAILIFFLISIVKAIYIYKFGIFEMAFLTIVNVFEGIINFFKGIVNFIKEYFFWFILFILFLFSGGGGGGSSDSSWSGGDGGGCGDSCGDGGGE